jgi:hypothetical protein
MSRSRGVELAQHSKETPTATQLADTYKEKLAINARNTVRTAFALGFGSLITGAAFVTEDALPITRVLGLIAIGLGIYYQTKYHKLAIEYSQKLAGLVKD